jgi:hypothetical protein
LVRARVDDRTKNQYLWLSVLSVARAAVLSVYSVAPICGKLPGMTRRPFVLSTVLALGVCGILVSAQRGGPDPSTDPFKGVTADGTVRTGLFTVRSTGVSTKPVVDAAQAFLKVLTPEQRKASLFATDDVEWRRWNNVHRAARSGVGFKEMTEEQRTRAFALLAAGLSAKGLEKTRSVMRLNETIAEMTKRFEEYGEWLYHLTVMGEPHATEPWGWQLEGHHLIVNYFVLGDQVVMTPAFMGSEPVIAESGKYAGTRVLQEEQQKGLALMQALTPEQQQKAVIEPGKKIVNKAQGQAFRDNLQLPYAGLRASEMSEKARGLLTDLVAEYVGNMPDAHAKLKMQEVRAHFADTYFAWIGCRRLQPGDPDRVRSPDTGGATRPEGSQPPAHSLGGANAQRQRLRQGPAAPTLRAPQARRGFSRRPESVIRGP